MDGVGTYVIEMLRTLACRDTPVYLTYRYSYKSKELENPIGFRLSLIIASLKHIMLLLM